MVEFYTNPRGWRARQNAAKERIQKKGGDEWEAVREQRRQHRERVAQGLDVNPEAEPPEDEAAKKKGKRKKKRKRIDGEEKSAKKTKPNKPKPGSKKKPSSKKRRKVDHAEA